MLAPCAPNGAKKSIGGDGNYKHVTPNGVKSCDVEYSLGRA